MISSRTSGAWIPGATILLSLISLGLSATAARKPVAIEQPLRQHLFDSTRYSANNFPREISGRPMKLNLVLSVDHIIAIDEKNQKLEFIATLTMTWLDEFLRWNTSSFSDIEMLEVSASSIWTPQISWLNSADRFIQEDVSDTRAIVFYDGTIFWRPGGVYSVYCNLNMYIYPFDRHTCEILLGLQTNDRSQIFIDLPYKMALINDGKEEQQDSEELWIVEYSEAHVEEYDLGHDSFVHFSMAAFSITMQRNGKVALSNIVAPCAFLSILALMIPLLPSESGERISLGITTFLAYSVYVLIVDDKMPSQMATMPLLQIYLVGMMVVTAAFNILAVIALKLYHYDPTVKPPSCLRCLIRPCCKPSKPAGNNASSAAEASEQLPPRESVYFISDAETGAGGRRRTRVRSPDKLAHARGLGENGSPPPYRQNNASTESNKTEENATPDYSEEWKAISHKFDMIVLAIGIIVTIGITAAVFVTIPMQSHQKDPGTLGEADTSQGISFLGGGREGGGTLGTFTNGGPSSGTGGTGGTGGFGGTGGTGGTGGFGGTGGTGGK